MSWKTLSLHFKQTYEGGYRYLDKCGEFMMAACDQYDCIPGEAKPQGGKMEIPEKGVSVLFDTQSLAITQELPAGDSEWFLTLCKGMAELATKTFSPKKVLRNGFACKSYWPISNVPDLLAASLKMGGTYHVELAKLVGMIPDHKKLDFTFNSGSKDLHVVMQPATFERVNFVKRNANYQASSHEKRRIERCNSFAERAYDTLSHALVLEIDLMESDPPTEAPLQSHFIELMQKNDVLRNNLQPS